MQTQLLTATKEFTWDMAHMLTGHLGLCQNLHGHTYKMEVTVARKHEDVFPDGPSEGMVVDFKDLKKIVNQLIVDPLDHATMINGTLDPIPDCFEVCLWDLLQKWNKKHVVVNYRPTAENMAMDFFRKINQELENTKANMVVIKLRLYETATSYAEVTL